MPDKNIQAELDAIRRSYIASLPEKQRAIQEDWNLLRTDWNAECFNALYIVLHGLAGSAETFGLPHITQAARKIVNRFKTLSKTSRPDQNTISVLSDEIDQFLEQLGKINQ